MGAHCRADGGIHRRGREHHRLDGDAHDRGSAGRPRPIELGLYLLAQAVTIPIYGRLADLYGRKRVLIVGSAIFLIGSALCGFAHDMLALVLYRGLQGLGAGAIMPVATTILGDVYGAQDRARVGGYISSVFGIAALVGPLLGAFLVQQVGWQTVFWINLPVGLASMIILALALHEHQPPHPHRI